MICDFCGTPTENIYAHVHLCPRCGLVQSEPRSDRTISTSCEADQGNLRNGKAFRFPQSLPILESIDWSDIGSALDIGANRGSFKKWMSRNHPRVWVEGVEPEVKLVDYGGYTHIGRFEDVEFEYKTFDFVFSSHTLEHAQSAREMMRLTAELMPIGSRMLLEVPNLATIQDPRVVEEFFIYKHNYHFSTTLLIPYLLDLGFEVERDESTMFDIRLLLRKRLPDIPYRALSFAVEPTRQWINAYANNLERNRAALPRVVGQLDAIDVPRVAYWGAGRIFDALVRYGGLSEVPRLVDGLLCGVVDDVHGIEVCHPDVLVREQPDVIVVLGRTSSDTMYKTAKEYAPEVLTFNDLLDGALA